MLTSEHRTFQRIVWRHPTTGVLQDYQLKTVTFGTTSAPYLAIRTLQQLAVDEKHNWPLAAEAVYNNFYVDDLLSGADDLSKAKELQQQLIQMMTSAGFNLRKWASNASELLQDLPVDHIELKNSLTFSDTESIKTLGIKWFPKEDYFTFIIKPLTSPSVLTKRIILSQIASLYDPIGWLAPVIIEAKILMQSLWITGSSWDEPVSENIQKLWTNFTNNLPVLEQLRIPRWIQYSTGLHMQLHGFCDASSKAYAAAIYLRVNHINGEITSHLLTAKTKVAPLKPITIPRLELNGALLLARLIKSIVQGMQLQDVPIVAWTDSQIVLQWLKDHPSKWKIYVANRVVEIQETLKFKQWRHIASIYNPADLASRGISANQLLHNESWWHGPTWLLQPPDKWPSNHEVIESTTLEQKPPTVTSFLINLEDNILLKYSSFTRLVHVTAIIQRFIHNCKNPNHKRVNMLTSRECIQAQRTIFKLVQQTAFPKEYQDLSQQRTLSKQSKLIRLNPMLDRDGLIRVGGRLDNALISYDRKHPIILPRDHHVTWIYIDKIHLETLHGNTSLVLNTTRNAVWILDGRRCISTRLHKCIICFRQRQATMTQLMGNLPSARVNITRPFSRIGIDYAGPVTVKSSTLRNAKLQKAYFCIFICMATKAVHIELVSNMTSDAFIAALKRFVSRRGLCTEIYSDCGTNFVGGKSTLDKELQQAIKQAWPSAAEYLTNKSISWHMNPPAAPHFGGLWESGVKSIKYHLRRSIGNSNLTFEEFATLLTQVEACLNSRPLCRVSNDPSDQFILTPGHFLIGQSLNAIPEPSLTIDDATYSSRWKNVQHITQKFWNHWSKDYLNQLQNRPKWFQPEPNIQKGDVVLLKLDNVTPTCWPLGVIDEVHPGPDGLVRVVQIRTQTNTFVRPINKICRLPMSEFTVDQDILDIYDDLNFNFSLPGSPINAAEFDPSDFNKLWSDLVEATTEAERSPETAATSTTNKQDPERTAKPYMVLEADTPQTNPVIQEPPIINGTQVDDLSKLRLTSTIKEAELRIDNSFQRFTTREGVDIFLPKHVIKKIDFYDIQKRRNKEKTLNLPDKYQVRLRVRADGKLMFFKYHKRGICRIEKRLNIDVQQGGECSANLKTKDKLE